MPSLSGETNELPSRKMTKCLSLSLQIQRGESYWRSVLVLHAEDPPVVPLPQRTSIAFSGHLSKGCTHIEKNTCPYVTRRSLSFWPQHPNQEFMLWITGANFTKVKTPPVARPRFIGLRLSPGLTQKKRELFVPSVDFCETDPKPMWFSPVRISWVCRTCFFLSLHPHLSCAQKMPVEGREKKRMQKTAPAHRNEKLQSVLWIR